MKKVFFSALLASSALVLLADSAFAKDCPNLKTSKIEVNDPNGDIALRTDTATEKQNIPESNGGRAVVNDGEKLLIYKNADPKKQSGICFYPVEINIENNSSPSNTNQKVLEYKPYWISQAGIKDYDKLTANDIDKDNTNNGGEEGSGEKGIISSRDGGDKSQSLFTEKMPWELILGAIFFTFIIFAVFKFRKPVLRKIHSQRKKSKSSNRVQDTQSRLSIPTQQSSYSGSHSHHPSRHVSTTSAVTSHTSQLGSNNQETMGSIIQKIGDLEGQIQKTNGYVKNLESSLKLQNQHIIDKLEDIIDSIRTNNLSSSTIDPLTGNKQPKEIFQNVNPEYNLLVLDQPDVGIDSAHSGLLQENVSETSHQDSFYNEVISKFNAGATSWFSSEIENRTFDKVQITRDSVLGKGDVGGQIIELELNDQGTLLIYQADDKLWVIPDPTQSKWKRVVKDSLFNGSSGQILVQPAEVESLGNGFWQRLQKGEFR